MWLTRHCLWDLTASPCPLRGGLHPEFVPGPPDGVVDGRYDADFACFWLARCEYCEAILGRERRGGRTLTWCPDEEIWSEQPGQAV